MKQEKELSGSPSGKGSGKLWVTLSILLFILVLLLLGYGPGGMKSEASSKMTTTLIDNPEHLKRISVLELENKLIPGLRAKIKKLEQSKVAKKRVEIPLLVNNFGPDDETEEMAGLRARSTLFDQIKPQIVEKVVEKTVDNPKQLKRIAELEKENKLLLKLRTKINKLEQDNPKHLQEISKLKKENGALAGLRKKIKDLESSKAKLSKRAAENQKHAKLIEKLKKENALVVTLRKRIKLLESTKPKVVEKHIGNLDLLNRIAILETENDKKSELLIRIKRLEKSKPKIIEKLVGNEELLKRITLLEKENGLIEVLKKRIKELERGKTVVVKKSVVKKKGFKKETAKKKEATKQIVNVVANVKTVKESDLIADLIRRVTKLESTYAIKLSSNTVFDSNSALIIELRSKIKSLEDALTKSRRNQASGIAETRIFFASGSYRAPFNSRLYLSPIINYLKSHPSSKIVLSGFHDKSGQLLANQLLAKQRARVVKTLLEKSGITSDRISVSQPAETLGTGVAAEARRVELKIVI